MGMLPNAAWDSVKKLACHASAVYSEKLGGAGSERAKGFDQLARDSMQLKKFFRPGRKARIDEIETETNLSREVLRPLMKLAGLIHERDCHWTLPG